MYLPTHFEETQTNVLHELIRSNPLGTLVTSDEKGLDANHIPFLIDAPNASAPYGTLRAHVARNNPVWQNQGEVLAVFQGEEAYISPAWYEEKKLNGAVVPTYNYAVVHARGKLRTVDQPEALLGLLNALTTRFESGRKNPWQVSDAPRDYIENMMKMIMGIEIPITHITGKWKASQNKSTQNRINITNGLRSENTVASIAMANLMENQLFTTPTK